MTGRPSFTCPLCRMTSYHPRDVSEGYCGNCHWWTGDPMLAGLPDSPRGVAAVGEVPEAGGDGIQPGPPGEGR